MNHLRTNLISTVTEHLNYDTMQRLGQSRNTKTVKAYLNAHADVPRKILDKIGNINDLKDFNLVVDEIRHLMDRPIFRDGKGLAPVFSALWNVIADFSEEDRLPLIQEIFKLMINFNQLKAENLRGVSETLLLEAITNLEKFPKDMWEVILITTLCTVIKTQPCSHLAVYALRHLKNLPRDGWEQRVATLIQASDGAPILVGNILHHTLPAGSTSERSADVIQIMNTWNSSRLYSSEMLMNICYALDQLPAEQRAAGFNQLETLLEHSESKSEPLVDFIASLSFLSKSSRLSAFICAVHLMKKDPELCSEEAMVTMTQSCFQLPSGSESRGLQMAKELIQQSTQVSEEIRNVINNPDQYFNLP